MAAAAPHAAPVERSLIRRAPGPALLLVAWIALNPRDAQAYLDAGSASLIFQAVLASVLGATVVLKAYWRQVKSFFGRGEQTGGPSEDDDG